MFKGATQNPAPYTEEEIQRDLPHLFLYGWYSWASEFRYCREKIALLCAGNQISKSSTQIRTCIDWATDTSLWPQLWPNHAENVNLFWYLYPSQKVVDAEFRTKWKQFLPKGRFKTHPKYGWKELKDGSHTIGIEFNTGLLMLFKTYAQKEIDLQTATVFALFCDEELPMRHYYEFMLRISAVDGYFRMVFTATLGQEFWRKVMEPDGDMGEEELLPHAWKRQVSLYEALTYEDGTPGGWTVDRIEGVKHNCVTHDEILRRVWGRFVVSLVDRKYPAFDSKRHFVKPHAIRGDWEVYAGVDVGSGNVPGSKDTGHPSAIAFVAVNSQYTQARLFLGWRGDDIGNTTAGDVMQKYLTMKSENNLEPTRKFYDQGCRDFLTISQRIGAGFEGAEKSHDVGDEIINLLFKNDVLKVFSEDPELQKFGWEISSVKKSTPKGKRKDDLVDAVRYAITKIPWPMDKFQVFRGKPQEDVSIEETYEEQCLRERRERASGDEKERTEEEKAIFGDHLDAEFDELNSLYGT